MPPTPPQLVKATLSSVGSSGPSTSVQVHFNPASLVYSVENSVSQQSGNPKKVQYVAQFSAKLTMDLQFDTTASGSDVRTVTKQVAYFMQASGNASASAQTTAAAQNPNDGGSSGPPPAAPPVLCFQWGSYQFQGIMDSFKETIDFFSADGVALRSLVSIGLSRQDLVIDDSGNLSPPPQSGSLVPSSSTDSALSLATRGGDPSAMRQLGTDNSLESLRFTNGASMQVSTGSGGAGVQLNPPAAFVTASASASAGLSLGISAGSSAGISIGASAGISAGVSVGGSAGVSAGVSVGTQSSGFAPAFGATASAGVLATQGAFAGLQTGRTPTSSTANLNPLQMLPATTGADVSSFAGASFSLSGAANSAGSLGLSTDVGAQFNFSERLTFSNDD
jgi:contractile injection system tube protein